jgi:ribosomal protein S14
MKKPNIKRSKFREKLIQYFIRIHFKKSEKIRWTLKIIVQNKNIEKQFKILSIFYLIQILKKSSITKQKNICLLSSWTKGVYPYSKLHRMSFIENAAYLYLPGFTINKW